jgi:hypothetical protein
MRNLTASDRSALIKLASSLPKGSSERKAILAGLRGSSKAASFSQTIASPEQVIVLWANSQHRNIKNVNDTLEFVFGGDREAFDTAVRLVKRMKDDGAVFTHENIRILDQLGSHQNITYYKGDDHEEDDDPGSKMLERFKGHKELKALLSQF